MNRRHFLAFAFWAVLAAALQTAAHAADDWIATWTASPHEVWAPDFLAPVKVPRNLWGQTVRQVARVSIGGRQVRVVLSNEFGPWPLKIGAAHVALSDKGSAIVAGSGRPLTFGGQTSIVIPPGAPVVSDPVDLAVAPLSSVVVSFFVPDVTPVTTFHWDAVQTTYVVAGNKVSETDFKADSTLHRPDSAERDPGGRARERAGDRDLRRLDHRRQQLDARHQPALARRAGAAAGRGRRAAGRGAERRHLRRAHPDRSHGRERAGPLRSRRPCASRMPTP